MGILIISLLVAATAGIFYFLVNHNDSEVANGKFLMKYQDLIMHITDKRKAEIKKVRSSGVFLKITLNKDYHFFSLAEVDNRLIVVWKLQSHSFGKRGKEWSFSTEYSQLKMYQEVVGDIRNYQERLRNEKPFVEDPNFSLV